MITIDITQDDATGALERLLAANVDLSPLMREFQGKLEAIVEDNFESEGRPGWAPLSPVTIAQREKEGKWPGKILQRTGQLAASMTGGHNATSAWVGTNVPYARTQHFGASKGAFGATRSGVPIPWGDIPSRPFFSATQEDREALLEMLIDYERRAASP